jgi:hypothetical protein
MLGLNSFLAFFVNLTNFLVTKHTSALTLQARPARDQQAACVPAAHAPCAEAGLSGLHLSAGPQRARPVCWGV